MLYLSVYLIHLRFVEICLNLQLLEFLLYFFRCFFLNLLLLKHVGLSPMSHELFPSNIYRTALFLFSVEQAIIVVHQKVRN